MDYRHIAEEQALVIETLAIMVQNVLDELAQYEDVTKYERQLEDIHT